MNTPTTSTWDPQLEALNNVLNVSSYSSIYILTDSHTASACLPKLLELARGLESAEVLEISAGEQFKSLRSAEELWTALNEKGADRSSCLVALGGGVITDLGGFVAATFRRGMSFILIPTSLLAMVDAAIGGKTGVNLGSLKNHVGVFAAPHGIYISPLFLETLPAHELRSGFAEMLKHGLIADAAYWEKCIAISTLNAQQVTGLIARSVQIKEGIVLQDPLEKGLRKALNFGHTIGHAVESLSLSTSSPLMHGEAVALGMIAELLLSEQKGLLSKDITDSSIQGIRKFFPELRVQSSTEAWWPYLLKDKKNKGGEVRCALLSAIGTTQLDVVLKPEDLVGIPDRVNASAR